MLNVLTRTSTSRSFHKFKPVTSSFSSFSLARAMDTTPNATKVTSHNQYHAPISLPDHPSELPANPMKLFQEWFTKMMAPDSGVKEPEAMALSTVSLAQAQPVPSTRIVLAKEVNTDAVVFYSNYNSRKGNELAANPWASAAFYWRDVSLSVRLVGKVDRLSEETSNKYFNSRPVGSRVGAWASQQSQPIASRDALEVKIKEAEQRLGVTLDTPNDHQIEKPPYWGGYAITPVEVEFWAGRENRLHDRFRYTRESVDTAEWKIERLCP